MSEFASLLRIAGPLAVTQISQFVMTLLAGILLGHLDASAFAAGGLAATIIQFLSVVSQGLLAGVQPILAGERGRISAGNAPDGAGGRAFIGSYVLVFILSALFIPFLLNIEHFLRLWGVAPEIASLCGRYCMFGAWALPGYLIVSPLRFHLAVEERAWVLMLVVAGGAAIYGVLLWLLIYGAPGVPALGVAGAGLAFAITWWLVALVLFAYVALAGLLPAGLKGHSLAAIIKGARDVSAIGWPIAIIYAAELGLSAVLAIMIGQLGTVALAANQITQNINNLAFMPTVALSQAATVRIAYHLGRNDPLGARYCGRLCFKVVGALMALVGLCLVFLGTPIVEIFMDTSSADFSAVNHLARVLLIILAVDLFFDGTQSIANGALRGLKDTRVPMLLGVASYWIIGFPVALICVYILDLGPIGVWTGILCGIGAAAIALYWRWHRKISALASAYQTGAPVPTA